MKLTQSRIWFICLLVLLLVTLIIPSVREVHLLCLRLVFPVNGKTFVQGQPSGCVLYTIPNVQFSDRYRAKLRTNTSQSVDDFALAWTTGDRFTLQIPPAQSWTNHPLLDWGALTCSYVACAYRTNAHDRENVFKIIASAQAAQPENGAFWLAEAALAFEHQQDDTALAALRLAAVKTNWTTEGQSNFRYFSKLYQSAGLSRLDAVSEAKLSLSDNIVGGIQGRIKEPLQRLMVEAVSSTNDDEFMSLFNLLVELRKADWSEGTVEARNTFRFFNVEDDLVDAMRRRMGVEAENSSDYIKQRDFKQKLFRHYLALQKNQVVVSRFWAQADAAQTEKQLRKELREGASYRWEMSALAWANATGAFAALALFLIFAAILLELPFAWFRKSGGIPGAWPASVKFWIYTAISFAISVAIGARFLNILGVFSIVGMRFGPSNGMSPPMQSVLCALGLCAFFLVGCLTDWKSRKKVFDSKYIFTGLGYVYVFAIIAMVFLEVAACGSHFMEPLADY